MKFHNQKLFLTLKGKPLRLSQDKKIAGFCAGLADCLNINVDVARIGFVIVAIFSIFPILIYVLAMFFLAESTDSEPN